jgi:hypothetical protein
MYSACTVRRINCGIDCLEMHMYEIWSQMLRQEVDSFKTWKIVSQQERRYD